jgi:hypothetical protein
LSHRETLRQDKVLIRPSGFFRIDALAGRERPEKPPGRLKNPDVRVS